MTLMAFLDDVDTEHISARARQITPGQVFASLLVALARLLGLTVFALGWVIAKAFSYAWFGAVWVLIAFAEGWNAGFTNVAAARRQE